MLGDRQHRGLVLLRQLLRSQGLCPGKHQQVPVLRIDQKEANVSPNSEDIPATSGTRGGC